MKKIILGAAVALLMSAGLFAKTWTNNIGVGFSVPVTLMSAKDPIFYDSGDTQVSLTLKKDKMHLGFNVAGMYLGYHENGFTVKGALSLGVGYASDYWISNDLSGKVSVDPALGFNGLETLGVGYSIVHTDKVVFSVLGGMGFQENVYSYKQTTGLLGQVYEDDITNFFFTFSLGADVTLMLRSPDGFGFFSSIYVGWIPFGTVSREERTNYGKASVDADLKGNVVIAPTIGVVWSF